MRERDATEPVSLVICDPGTERELVSVPQNDDHAASLEEHGLLDLLATPAQPLVEGAGAGQVCTPECDQADPLLHDGDRSRQLHRSKPVGSVGAALLLGWREKLLAGTEGLISRREPGACLGGVRPPDARRK